MARGCGWRHPEKPTADRVVWVPRYGPARAVAAGCELRECPKSVAARSQGSAMVGALVSIRAATKATGASLYGPTLAHWPAKIADAMAVIEAASNEAEVARMSARGGGNDNE